jgi:hypothetical protein
MLMCCVYAFSLRRESPDMILEDEPLISEVVLSQLVIRARLGVKHTLRHLKITTTLSERNG